MLTARRCAHLCLALVLTFFAVAPHEHEGLREHVSSDVATNLGTCDAPAGPHLHASREVPAKPCVACVRHFSAGALHPRGSAAEPLVAAATFVAARHFALAASIVFTPLRAPPA